MKNKNLAKNKLSYVLYFNASKENNLDVFLLGDTKVIDKINLAGDYKVSENLLKLINKILKKNKVAFSELRGIITVIGPGPFTSLRIALAIANTLAYGLKIPVIGISLAKKKMTNLQVIKSGLLKLDNCPTGQYIEPFYDKEPNITKAKILA